MHYHLNFFPLTSLWSLTDFSNLWIFCLSDICCKNYKRRIHKINRCLLRQLLIKLLFFVWSAWWVVEWSRARIRNYLMLMRHWNFIFLKNHLGNSMIFNRSFGFFERFYGFSKHSKFSWFFGGRKFVINWVTSANFLEIPKMRQNKPDSKQFHLANKNR